MRRMATAHGSGNEKFRAVLSVVAVVTGTWLSGVVDRPAAESNANEAIGEFDGVWTWVAESPAADARSDEPVVSYSEVPRGNAGTVTKAAPRASARHGRES